MRELPPWWRPDPWIDPAEGEWDALLFEVAFWCAVIALVAIVALTLRGVVPAG